MNVWEMKKLSKHFDHYFKQTEPMVFHPWTMRPHIDTLRYPPTDELPYLKLATTGASDYKMPAEKASLGNRNEYIMLVDGHEDLLDKKTAERYIHYLTRVALYPVLTHCPVTYGHSFEWEPEDGKEMVGAYLEMPQFIDTPDVMRCRGGLFKTVICLQVVLLTRQEIDRLLQIGPEQFSYYLYPEDENAPRHFICELHRSERF